MPTTRRDLLLAALAWWPLARPRTAPAVAVSPDRIAEIEWHVVFLTNQQRIWRKLPPLEPSAALADIARGHSRDMLKRGFFDHRTPEGLGPEDRIARQGLRFTTISENIYSVEDGTTDAAELASNMVTAWMNTKVHRRNILDPGIHSLGVGVAATRRLVLATQLFAG
jgi:uncharacterized protein YkwD